MTGCATMPAGQAADAVQGAAAASDEAKALATLQARAALAGWELARFTEPDGSCSYCLSKWGRALTLPDLASVVQHVRRVGASE